MQQPFGLCIMKMMRNADFFRDEVRNGFYIPCAVKQAWAIALDVLKEIDRICAKYDIRYFADWGTLLGAVRHSGFVPWDDDLDICMLRDDYNKFREVADAELPGEFVIHDYERQEDHWEFTVRVVNNSKICFDKDHLDRSYNFPWLVGVDVFVKDYIYLDPEKEKKRSDEIMYLIALTESILAGELSKSSLQNNLDSVNSKHNSSLNVSMKERDICIGLFKIAETLMNEVSPNETDLVEQIYPWIIKGAPGKPKADYDDIVRLPFEDTTIPVPASYNRILTMRYNDYLKIHKVWGGHDYPFFEAQKAELEKINGAPLPEYRFDLSMLGRDEVDRGSSLKSIAASCLDELNNLLSSIEDLSSSDNENLLRLLEDSQQLSVEFGELIETVKGSERRSTKNIVRVMEEYCEMLYNASQGEAVSSLRKIYEQLVSSVEENLLNRKEIAFFPIGPSEWKGMEKFYIKASSLEDTDIYVVPLPLMTKDIYGQITMSDEEIESASKPNEYPSDLPISDWKTFDISLH